MGRAAPRPGEGSVGGFGKSSRGVRAAARDLGIDRNEALRSLKIDSLSDEAKANARAGCSNPLGIALLMLWLLPTCDPPDESWPSPGQRCRQTRGADC